MIRLFLFLVLIALLGSCAIVSRPTGGEKDTTPPQLDSLASTPNFQTNFYPEEVVLEFDEYIQLKNASRDIVLTPTPASGKPKYEQRAKRVNIDFRSVEFRDSTTYQLQFGQAIQDFNEGNPAKALRYVFSTGSFLDSLSILGTVKDNVTGEPSIETLVGLYRSTSDTILAKAAPDYFTRTDSSGRFQIGYLSPGAYQLAAYSDDNSNYRYNQGSEAVGFLDRPIAVSDTGSTNRYDLIMSAEKAPLKALRGDQWFAGLIRITLNQPALETIQIDDVPGETLARYQDADSLYVAYAPANDTLPFVVISAEGESDTVRLRKTALSRAPAVVVTSQSEYIPGEAAIEMNANLPIKSYDVNLIDITVDSISFAKGTWSISEQDPRALNWVVPTDTVRAFKLTFLPGAITTVFDSMNTDSLYLTIRPSKKQAFGEVELTLVGLDSLTSYVLELLDSKENIERTIQLPAPAEGRQTPEESLSLARVEGGDYSIRVIQDLNNDGRYSPGNRRLNLQPERSKTFTLNTVRADWLVEERIQLNF